MQYLTMLTRFHHGGHHDGPRSRSAASARAGALSREIITREIRTAEVLACVPENDLGAQRRHRHHRTSTDNVVEPESGHNTRVETHMWKHIGTRPPAGIVSSRVCTVVQRGNKLEHITLCMKRSKRGTYLRFFDFFAYVLGKPATAPFNMLSFYR